MAQEDTPTPTTTTNPPPPPQPTTTKVKHLILDTGALIKGQGYTLSTLATHFWTIPEVIAEVRDPKARFHLDTLPFELHTREPSLEACKAVSEFARKTGDYSALSRVDLRVLALTWMMEVEEGGGEGVRSAASYKVVRPGGGGGNGGGGEKEEEVERVYVEVEESDEDEEGEDGESESESEGGSGTDDEEEEAEKTSTPAAPTQTSPPPPPSSTVKAGFSWAAAVKTNADKPPPPPRPLRTTDESAPAIPFEKLNLEEEKEKLTSSLKLPPPPATPQKTGETTSRLLGAAGRSAATRGEGGGGKGGEGGEEEEDDGTGWVNVTNIKDVRARGTDSLFGARKGEGYHGAKVGGDATDTHTHTHKHTQTQASSSPTPPPPTVACVTTDFGMQNVLLQMNLPLLSIDGIAITRIKQWARRCESCAKIVHDQERMFCPRCGNAYLSRVSISVDSATGQLKVHLSKLWRPRKGQKYSLPKPGHNHKHGQGRFQGELLLREDQLKMGIWQQKVKRRNKALDSMFGADITEMVGMSVSKTAAAEGIQFGYGKKNPNAQRGRERRGKKKKSTK